ncbi:MAG: hypothetical protein HY716_16455 [Planctomycetes bacterium]|nr:hypothetical protein [Planctomycetota bacterium]
MITVIDPGAYPEIASANDNRFARLPNTERLREFEEICAKVLAAATVERRWQKVKVEKLVNAA